MTTYKSAAVNAGIMPDYSRAGVLLCRSAVYTVTTAPVSGDTIQMVPIPNGAQIVNIQVENNSLIPWNSIATLEVGDGSDTDRFFFWAFTGQIIGNDFANAPTNSRAPRTTDLIWEYTNDDTIDFYFNGTINTGPTGCSLVMHVFYKMAGEINDEDFSGTD